LFGRLIGSIGQDTGFSCLLEKCCDFSRSFLLCGFDPVFECACFSLYASCFGALLSCVLAKGGERLLELLDPSGQFLQALAEGGKFVSGQLRLGSGLLKVVASAAELITSCGQSVARVLFKSFGATSHLTGFFKLAGRQAGTFLIFFEIQLIGDVGLPWSCLGHSGEGKAIEFGITKRKQPLLKNENPSNEFFHETSP
jgi:hypothetical protein